MSNKIKPFKSPIVQQVARGKAKIIHDYYYQWNYRHDKNSDDLNHYRIRVPAGYVYNGASIPRVFWTIIGTPPFGAMDGPSAVHDYIYEKRGSLGADFQMLEENVWRESVYNLRRSDADFIFLWAMQDSGFFKKWRTDLYYKAVSKFGKTAWDD